MAKKKIPKLPRPLAILTFLLVCTIAPFKLYSQSESNYRITLKEKRKHNILTIRYTNNDSVEVEKTYYGFRGRGTRGKKRTAVKISWPCRAGYIDYAEGTLSDTVRYVIDDGPVSSSPISPTRTYTAKIYFPKDYPCKLIDRVFNPTTGAGIKLIIDLSKSKKDAIVYTAERVSNIYEETKP